MEVDVDEDIIDEVIFGVVEKSKIHQRTLKFWEVYVDDEGNLVRYLRQTYPDVEVAQFSLPRWNFEDLEIQRDFRKLAAQEKPHHMMMAPECRPWSLMQNLNYRTPERRALLQDMRNLEEETHLKFYEKVHADSKKIYFDCTLQPADAAAWLMPTLENMKGYYETVLDRCGIGLKASPDDPRMVRKPTKFRSTSKKVCVAVNLRCQCDIGHTQMMGRGAVLKAMQNYEPDLVRRLGDAIYESMAEVWKRRGQAELMTLELVEHSNEEMQYLGTKQGAGEDRRT